MGNQKSQNEFLKIDEHLNKFENVVCQFLHLKGVSLSFCCIRKALAFRRAHKIIKISLKFAQKMLKNALKTIKGLNISKIGQNELKICFSHYLGASENDFDNEMPPNT